MKKIILWAALLILLTFILSSFENFRLEAILHTFYTVSSIMFSIGMGLIVTFSLDGIKNKSYITHIRFNILNVRKSFIIYFILSTLFYICCQCFDNTIVIYKNIKVFLIIFTYLFILLSILYYVVNFIAIQKLKDDIFDRLSDENK